MRPLASLALLALVACSANSPTAPSPPEPTPTQYRLATVPAYFEGFYVEGRYASEPPGGMHIYLLSWDDDMDRITRPGFVSVHCCMWSGARFDTSNWQRIVNEWIIPLERRGLLAGIYVVDEPGLYGISDEEVAKASTFFGEQAYPTMAVRSWGNRRLGRLPVDYYSVTGYSFETKKEWVRDFHRTADTDFIVGQAFDAGVGYEKGIPDQAFWRETARIAGKGIISWVWRWQHQTGCGDDPTCSGAWL